MGSGHAHRHRAGPGGAGVEVARGPRAVLLAFLALAAVATVVGLFALWPSGADVEEVTGSVSYAAPGVTFPTATVRVVQPACPRAEDGSVEPGPDCGQLRVRVEDGADEGSTVSVSVPPEVSESGLEPGDTVRLQRVPGDEASFSYFGTERRTPLLVMTLVFVVLVIAVARWRGFFALLGLAFSGLVIWEFLLPALLTGEPGVAVGLVASGAIMFVVLYSTHGVSIRTSAALAGTLVGVLVTAGLGVVAVDATRLTGVEGESGAILTTFAGDLDFQGLFACAIVIAGLGVLNDVTITQASSVWEIRSAAPDLGRRQVFAGGMRIGRDHIASTIYTIVFAYAGTALAVLLILQLYGLPIRELLATEEITTEIVRTLASSIGLVLAVPLTTGIAALTVPGPRRAREDVR